MHYHIILTEICNSQCKYCYEKSMKEFGNDLEKRFHFDFEIPHSLNISGKKIAEFLEDYDTLIFYGGEPLINLEKMKEIIDEIEKIGKKIYFCMQTNGKLLNSLPFEYLNKFSKILISIDGERNRTDYNRGPGTYELVLKNIIEIREKGFDKEIVARMVVSPNFSDVFEQVNHIIELIEKKIFDSIHWQIDAGFYKFDFNKNNFKEFVKEYNKSIELLVDLWIDYMKKHKKVLKIYPFLGIFECIYYNKKTKLQCGSGHENYTISTNGNLVACPVANGIKEFYCGDLETPKEKIKKIYVQEPCIFCKYLDICGGRCLYSNYAKLWPKEGYDLICKTIIYLIEKIKKEIPKIKELIKEKVVLEEDFKFERYFGPEIIP